MEFKEDFKDRYQKLLGDNYTAFEEISQKYINKAIRVNTLKISVEDLKKRLEDRWILTPVPWCSEAFWIKYRDGDRFDIGNLPEHQLGYIYVQDPASMIPPVVLSPKPGDIVLDMCSAPGSKTTQLAMYMENKGVLIANDESGKRLSALGLNLTRCGVSNCIINHSRGEMVKGEYDKISVDAPCSGTGTIRRNFKIAEMYSFGLVKRMQSIQKKLISKAFELLKPGGILVYSTCTLEPEENEEVIDFLLKKYSNADVLDINLNIKRQPAVLSFEGKTYDTRVSKVLRILPQDNDTEGFFVCKIIKN